MSMFIRNKGFTLIEIIIVVAVIAILTAAIIPSINRSREKSRDTQRISDFARIEFALEIYLEANGEFPDLGNQASTIGEGSALDADLVGFMGVVPKDPRSGEVGFGYLYKTNVICNGVVIAAVIYAEQMERSANKNSATVCPNLINPDDGYVIFLGGL